MQLMLFDDPIEVKLEKNVMRQNESIEKMRKKLFAENSYLKKEMRELKEELNFLKANICKGEFIL